MGNHQVTKVVCRACGKKMRPGDVGGHEAECAELADKRKREVKKS